MFIIYTIRKQRGGDEGGRENVSSLLSRDGDRCDEGDDEDRPFDCDTRGSWNIKDEIYLLASPSRYSSQS